jgi:hypothetical protein
MEEVDLEQLERWMIRKMQRDKKKQPDSNGILITLECDSWRELKSLLFVFGRKSRQKNKSLSVEGRKILISFQYTCKFMFS